MTLCINSKVAAQICYMIIASGVELLKLGNECLQLYKHSTSMFLVRLQYFQQIKFNFTKFVIIK